MHEDILDGGLGSRCALIQSHSNTTCSGVMPSLCTQKPRIMTPSSARTNVFQWEGISRVDCMLRVRQRGRRFALMCVSE